MALSRLQASTTQCRPKRGAARPARAMAQTPWGRAVFAAGTASSLCGYFALDGMTESQFWSVSAVI